MSAGQVDAKRERNERYVSPKPNCNIFRNQKSTLERYLTRKTASAQGTHGQMPISKGGLAIERRVSAKRIHVGGVEAVMGRWRGEEEEEEWDERREMKRARNSRM